MYRIKIYVERSDTKTGEFIRVKEIRLLGVLVVKKVIVDSTIVSLSPNARL